MDGVIYGGRSGFDGDGFYANAISGGEVIDGFTLISEREIYRKPIDWLRVKKVILAILLAVIITIKAWFLAPMIPIVALGKGLAYAGSLVIIVSQLLGNPNIVHADSDNYCEIE